MNPATNRLTGESNSVCGVSTCCSCPSRSTQTRSPRVMASTWSWVTYTVVVPSRSCSWFSAARMDTRSLASRLDSGSSIRNAGGLADDRPAHRHALPLAAGQRGGLAGQVRLEAEHLRRLADPALDLRLGRVPQLQPEGQVVRHRHVRVQRVVLEHHRDVAVLRRQVVDHPLADRDGPAGDLLQPGDGPQRGRLPAPGRPDEHHELAFLHLKVQVVERLDAPAVNLLHVVERDTRHSETSMSGPCPQVRRHSNR